MKDQVEPLFKRNHDKPEAGVTLDPNGNLAFLSEKQKKKEKDSIYEVKVNSKVALNAKNKLNETGGFGPPSPRSQPTITFDAKELYEQAHGYLQQKPSWRGDADHPINNYLCESEKPKFKSVSDLFGLPKEEEEKSYREKRLMSLVNKDKRNSLQLAATMAL